MTDAVQATATAGIDERPRAERTGAQLAMLFKLSFWLLFFAGLALAGALLKGTATTVDLLGFMCLALLVIAAPTCYLAARAARAP